jgi:hypothetical protein
MKLNHIKVFLLIGIIALLPGCRYMCWLNEVFYQGCPVPQYDLCPYIRTIHLYDQTSTIAHFDTLWLTKEVRTLYLKAYADRRCLSEERYRTLLRRQHEEAKHYISFYVLAAFPGDDTISLSDKNAPWTITLVVNTMCYTPSEIKIAEIAPEYINFFGKRWTQFKKPYLVRFNAKDQDGDPIIPSGTCSVELHFASVVREAGMQWSLHADRTPARECCDNTILAYDLYPCRGI